MHGLSYRFILENFNINENTHPLFIRLSTILQHSICNLLYVSHMPAKILAKIASQQIKIGKIH